MSKKILAGVLAAASILSVSSVASAETTKGGDTKVTETNQNTVSYVVDMTVTYGTVSAEIPDTSTFNKAFLNPYGATVKTIETEVDDKDTDDKEDDETTTTVIAKNNSEVASGVFFIKNLDEEEKLRVVAKTKITKATGVVVKNPTATAPFGWAQVSPDKDKPYDYLTDYDKLTLKNGDGKGVKETDGISAIDTTKSTGGAVSAKQGKNIGMWLVGGIKASELKTGETANNLECNVWNDKTNHAAWNWVEFDPKTETTGDLMTIAASDTGYFMLGGQLSEVAKSSIDDTKDSVKFTVVFKLSPVKA